MVALIRLRRLSRRRPLRLSLIRTFPRLPALTLNEEAPSLLRLALAAAVELGTLPVVLVLTRQSGPGPVQSTV